MTRAQRSGRVLLVEDDASDVDVILEAMARVRVSGKVDVARDGEEALDYLFRRGKYERRSGGDPAVILLDLGLPRLGGLEVLRQIKENPALQLIPVVVLTSSREEREIAQSYDVGANAYVVKPLGLDQFTRVIEELGSFWALLNEPPPDGLSGAPARR
jgi:CheY-like chemotaxis protein